MESEKKNGIQEIKQKALKITEALYRTTDLFYDVEPLKWSLRETSLSIFEIVSGIDGKPEHEQNREAEKLNNLVKKLFLKLELASSGTFISRTNFNVLEREYASLGHSLKQNINTTALLDLPTNQIGVPIEKNLKNDDQSDTSVLLDTQQPIKDKISDIVSGTVSVTNNDNAGEHKKVSNKKLPEINTPQVVSVSTDSKRRDTIIEALKIKGPSSIGDLAELFYGTISEKTVQRELSSLVAAGNVKQGGEKRWRRYFL